MIAGVALLVSPALATAAAPTPPCAVADALRAAGESAAARSDYVALLRRNPAETCASAGLKELAAKPPATLSSRLDGIASALPDVLLLLGLVGIGVFALLLLGHSRWMHRGLARVWGIGRMLSPRLTLKPLGDQSGQAVGATIDARIQRHLAEMRRLAALRQGPSYEMDFSTPDEDFADLVAGDGGLQSALDKASASSEHMKIVTAVLTLLYTLLPTQRLTVTGVVEPVIGPRASATLNLDEGGRPIAAATLLGSIPEGNGDPKARDFVTLSEPAAVWVQYEVARAIRGDIDRGPNAAVSYALVREGLENELAGDTEAARAKFEQAHELDDRNWAASLNLAMTEARLANDYARAIEILDSAFAAIQR